MVTSTPAAPADPVTTGQTMIATQTLTDTEKQAALLSFIDAVETATGYQPRKNGSGYKCQCPAHEDDQPSLSVQVADKPHIDIIVKCFAGCDYSDIMRAVGWGHRANGNGSGPTNGSGANGNGTLAARPKQKKKKKSRGLGKLVARYPYYNEKSEFIYEKRRYEPKTFRVKNRRTWGLGDHDPVLYNLPMIMSTGINEVVFVVEGEKDADALSLFAVATCNFDGAGPGKWRSQYSSYLYGRRVVVIPDNDKPGRAFAEEVAGAVAGVADWCKVVELPDVGPGGDVSDWLAAGGTPQQLWALVEAADPARPREKDFTTEKPATNDYRKGLRWLGYEIRLNTLDNTLEVNGSRMDDVIEARIRADMYDLGFKGKARMADAVLIEAGENSYHPIREFFDELEWDGTDWLKVLLDEYVDESTGLGYAAFKRWMIGSVARVYQSGTRNYMLVWDGPQEVGKSTLARWMCPLQQYHIEEQINPDDKDIKRYLATKWIWEVAEVDATTKRSDVSALKDFISKREITIRPAYARHDLVRPSLASFIGTINSDGAGFLRDKTGNTRFVTIHLESVDWSYSDEMDPSNLWAQAVALYKSGEPWRLTEQEDKLRRMINADYETESFLEALFDAHFCVDPARTDVFLSSVNIIQYLEEKGLKGSQRGNLTELQAILKKTGATKARRTIDGQKLTVYLGVWHRGVLEADTDDLDI